MNCLEAAWELFLARCADGDMAARFGRPDIWVERLRREIREASEEIVLVDDLRMMNEYAMLREEGAKIVRITVPGRMIVPSETEG